MDGVVLLAIVPFRGLETDASRAWHDWPNPELADDPAGTQFKAVLSRPAATVAPLPPLTVFGSGEASWEVRRLLAAMTDETNRAEIQNAVGLKHEDHFRESYLHPAQKPGLIEMTAPDKSKSRLQRYRPTARGVATTTQQNLGNAVP